MFAKLLSRDKMHPICRFQTEKINAMRIVTLTVKRRWSWLTLLTYMFKNKFTFQVRIFNEEDTPLVALDLVTPQPDITVEEHPLARFIILLLSLFSLYFHSIFLIILSNY